VSLAPSESVSLLRTFSVHSDFRSAACSESRPLPTGMASGAVRAVLMVAHEVNLFRTIKTTR
jgi:hypothetical protein